MGSNPGYVLKYFLLYFLKSRRSAYLLFMPIQAFSISAISANPGLQHFYYFRQSRPSAFLLFLQIQAFSISAILTILALCHFGPGQLGYYVASQV
jgi:uncharacterized membrane protein